MFLRFVRDGRSPVVLPALEVVVEYDCGGYFVDYGFVAACHFLHAAVNHGAVGYSGGEALVEKYYFHIRERLAQLSDAGPDIAHGVGLLAAHRGGVAHDDGVDGLARHVALDKFHELRGIDRSQSRRDNAQSIGHRDAAATPTVINRE